MLISGIKDPEMRRRAIKGPAEARESSTSEGLFPKLVDDSGGSACFKDKLPATANGAKLMDSGIYTFARTVA